MLIHDAKKATINRFTNLLDGGILPKVSVYEILDYYEALKSNVPVAVSNNCNITRNFLEDQIQEYENDEEEDYG
jgi:hypothetical protein